jgi:DNA oxidative demethylase
MRVSRDRDVHQTPRKDEAPSFPSGFHFLPGFLDETAQRAVLVDIRSVLEQAPLFQQTMPRTGAPLSVRMSNAGEFGWVTDRDDGYRYQGTHPLTHNPWPPIPARLVEIWSQVTNENKPPNLCLINYYDQHARLGLHQDRGDGSLDAPVVSISLGDDATFVLGGLSRKHLVRRFELHSGDVVWFGGPSRLIYHGIDGIQPGSSRLLPEGGRFNITLRRIE